MPNKLSLVLMLVFVYLSFFKQASAEILINEFVSHPNTGEKEWVELKNTSSSPVELSGWKLTELSSPNTNPKENNMVSLSGVIDDFMVFEISSSKLNDAGDSIALYDGDSLVGRVTYGNKSSVKNYSIDLSAPGVGESGALVSSSWQVNSSPTRNYENADSGVSESEEDNTENEEDVGEEKEESEKAPITNKKPKAEIKTKGVVYVGIPFKVEGVAYGSDGLREFSGRYFWNFGDGSFREVKAKGVEEFTHTYFYPGEYEILFEYYPNYFTDVTDSSDILLVKVIDPKISISKTGDVNDFFVELTNNASFDTDISGWMLSGLNKTFIFPKNSRISAKKKMTISPKISGLSFTDKNSLRLIDSEGQVIYKYTPSYRVTGGNTDITFSEKIVDRKEGEIIPKKNLASSASYIEDEAGVVPLWFSVVSLIFLIGIGVASVYYIRRKRTGVGTAGEDFEILDE